MSVGKKMIFVILLISALLFSFYYFGKSSEPPASETDAFYEETTVFQYETLPYMELHTTSSQQNHVEENQKEVTLPQNEAVYYADVPELETPVEVKDYLNYCVEQGRSYGEFVYLGDGRDITISDLAGMVCAYYVNAAPVEAVENAIRVEFYKYPGERIIEFYKSGRLTELSKEETETFIAAWNIVKKQLEEAEGIIELEIALHDYLCENVSYVEYTEEIPDSETLVRPLTAVGALLDGEANCQGYTDAFYLLMSLAGFTVGKQSTPDHIFNTVLLDGKWYIVDVTFDDGCFSKYRNISSYYLFNAGLDRAGVYNLKESRMRYNISDSCDRYYYYNLSDEILAEDYQRSFDNIEDAAVAALLQYGIMGEAKQHIMIKGKTHTTIDFSRQLNNLNKQMNPKVNYSIKVLRRDGDTFFYVEFRE